MSGSPEEMEEELKRVRAKGEKLYDPFGWLGKEKPSQHCKGEKAVIIGYDHTGAIRLRCKCGVEYNFQLVIEKK